MLTSPEASGTSSNLSPGLDQRIRNEDVVARRLHGQDIREQIFKAINTEHEPPEYSTLPKERNMNQEDVLPFRVDQRRGNNSLRGLC